MIDNPQTNSVSVPGQVVRSNTGACPFPAAMPCVGGHAKIEEIGKIEEVRDVRADLALEDVIHSKLKPCTDFEKHLIGRNWDPVRSRYRCDIIAPDVVVLSYADIFEMH